MSSTSSVSDSEQEEEVTWGDDQQETEFTSYNERNKSRKKRRKWTKEDAMLGIFKGDSDEDAEEMGQGRKEDTLKTAPIFVKSDKNLERFPSTINQEPEHVDYHTVQIKQEKPKQPPIAAVAVDKQFGAWDVGGKAMKMMQKMGYQKGQGLGPAQAGRVLPVETKMRPGKIGLAFQGFKEKIEPPPTSLKKPGGSGKKYSLVREEDGEPVWRKRRQPKIRYDLENIPPSSLQHQHQDLKIIDMTSKQIREITAAEFKSGTPTGSNGTILASELRYNLLLLQQEAMNEVEELAVALRKQENQLQQLRNESQALQKQLLKRQKGWEKSLEVESLIQSIQNKWKISNAQSNSDSDDEKEDDLEELFGQDLKKLYADNTLDFLQFGLDKVAAALLAAHMKKSINEWNPFLQPAKYLKEIMAWRHWFSTGEDSIKMAPGLFSKPHHDHHYDDYEQQKQRKMTPFESVLHHVWLPRVRSTICNEWEPYDLQHLQTFFEHWPSPFPVPRYLKQMITSELIQPRLVQALRDYNPRRDRIKLHVWLHSYLEILSSEQLEELWQIVREKFSLVLRDWHPSDVTVSLALKPWQAVWKPLDWKKFMKRHIIPKLEGVLSEELEINPSDQDYGPVDWVLNWRFFLSDETLAEIISRHFFPKWLLVLQAWLTSPQADYEEITQWYLHWKERFPEDLGEQDKLQRGFHKALDLMNSAV